ncbi:MAG: hypothetical protein ACJ746_14665 [Bryobacteraceae bacterium]
MRWPIWMLMIAVSALHAVGGEAPKAEISNGQIRAVIYLPDPQTGFYRSTRFDWSGVVGSLKYRGHEYYGPWFYKVDPNVRDYSYDDSGVVVSPVSGTVGPAEEYETDGKGLGYDEAKGGGTFIKIGVGVLRKPLDEAKYDHYRPYEIVNPGKWTVHKTAASVEFTQELSDPTTHYGYKYTKVVRLEPGKTQLVIEHAFKNIGSRAITSSMYNHNFLVLDNQPPGPNLVTKTVYPINPQTSASEGPGQIRGSRLIYLKPLQGKERMTASLAGFGNSASDFDFRVEQRATGAGVRITGDHPLANVSVWSIRTVFALEPFVAFTIEPGAETKWTFTYDYYLLPKAGEAGGAAEK